MPTALFQPDPLLARAEPRGVGAFHVLPLLMPARPSFRTEQVRRVEANLPALSAPAVTRGEVFVEDAQRLPAPATAVSPGVPQVTADATRDSAANATVNATVNATANAPAHATVSAPVSAPVSATGAALFTAEQVEQLVAARYREGFEEGLAQGAKLALSDAMQDMPADSGRDDDGLTAGAQGSDAQGSDAQAHLAGLLQAVGQALLGMRSQDEAGARFEPLKRLALHLAAELVRVEMRMSPHIVDSLVQRCVQALDAGAQPVTVELHPQDLEMLQSAMAGMTEPAPLLEALKGVQWREDPELARGSVRARSEQSCVEDLIEHRLAGLVRDLGIQAEQWQRDQAALRATVDQEEPDA